LVHQILVSGDGPVAGVAFHLKDGTLGVGVYFASSSLAVTPRLLAWPLA